MDTPQEIEVWFILPAVRRQFVLAMKEKGMKQKDIARMMGLTAPAVSQYIKSKRGERLEFSEKILKKISVSAAKVSEGSDFRKELQKILSDIKKTKFMCNVCHDQIGAPKSCDICFIG